MKGCQARCDQGLHWIQQDMEYTTISGEGEGEDESEREREGEGMIVESR